MDFNIIYVKLYNPINIPWYSPFYRKIGMKSATMVIGDKSGIMMEVFKDEPGL